MSKKIKITILDKHPIICSALSYFLGRENGLDVIGTYSNRDELIADNNQQAAEILILDYSLGDNNFDGVMLIKHLLFRAPTLKIIIFSDQESSAIVQEAISAGAKAYVGKSKSHEYLLEAIYSISSKDCVFLPPDLKQKISRFRQCKPRAKKNILNEELEVIEKLKLQSLSTREIEVIRCMLEGRNITEISIKFSRSRKTISAQKQSALRKLGISSNMELFLYRDFIMNDKTIPAPTDFNVND